MSSPQRNAERTTIAQRRKTCRCVACLRLRRPDQVELSRGDYLCLDTYGCIAASPIDQAAVAPLDGEKEPRS